METLSNSILSKNQYKALEELRHRLFHMFDVESLILFGSAARGEADEESDCDLLVVTTNTLTRPERHEITDVVFDVNLQHDTSFSTLVVDLKSWEGGPFSILPIRDEIIRDGIHV